MSGKFDKIKKAAIPKVKKVPEKPNEEEFLDDKVQNAIKNKFKKDQSSRPSLKDEKDVKRFKRAAAKHGAVVGGKGAAYGSAAMEGSRVLGKVINAAVEAAKAVKELASPQGVKAIVKAALKNAGSKAVGFIKGAGTKVGGFLKSVLPNSVYSAGSSVMHFIGGGLVKAGSSALSMVGITGTSTVAAGAVGALMPGFIIVGSTVAYGIQSFSNNINKFDGPLVDCIKEVNASRKGYGKGKIVIPEEIKGMRVGYTTTWECPYDWAVKHISPGTNQRKAVEMWGGPDGTKADENGFGRIKDYYLVAIRVNAYGQKDDQEAQIGDHITFYLSDGTAIETMVWDAKGPTSGTDGATGKHFDYLNGTSRDEEHTMAGHGRFNGWGHIAGTGPYEVNILEFAGNVSENNHLEKITGKKGLRVASATNHGPAPEWVKYNAGTGSASSGISDTIKKSKSKHLGSILNKCMSAKVGKYDNTSIAKAAVSFAYPNSSMSHGNDGTPLYRRVHDNVGFRGAIYQDCLMTVATAIRWSGADDNYPFGYMSETIAYMDSSPKWKKVGEWGNGLNYEDMEPGDVLVVSQKAGLGPFGHIFLYVGKDLIQEFHGSKANPTSDSVAGSHGVHSPECDESMSWFRNGDSQGRGYYMVYRNVEHETNSKYKNAGEE